MRDNAGLEELTEKLNLKELTEDARQTLPLSIAKPKPLQSYWDLGLLGVLTVAILSMVGYLLWPQPMAVIRLKPYPAHLITNVVDGSDLEVDAGNAEGFAAAEKPKSRSHRTTRKKPAKPPVLNLNTATASQLQLLPGIGPKMAQRITEYRKSHGRFADVAAIQEVKGIGPKKFEKLKPFLKL